MTFLTIEEAVTRTGKSESTIRRLIRSLSDGEQKKHLKKERLANGGYKYRISVDIITSKIGLTGAVKSKVQKKLPARKTVIVKPVNKQYAASSENLEEINLAQQYIESLERQLHVKDNQLQEKDKQISDLIDRDRESNLLLDKINDALIKHRIPELLEAQAISFQESNQEVNEPEDSIEVELPKKRGKNKKNSSKKRQKKKRNQDLVSDYERLNDGDEASFSKWMVSLSKSSTEKLGF